MLKELEAEGHLEKRRRSYRDPDKLPPVVGAAGAGAERGRRSVRPPAGMAGRGAEPRVLVVPRQSDPALGEGDRILARLTEVRATTTPTRRG